MGIARRELLISVGAAALTSTLAFDKATASVCDAADPNVVFTLPYFHALLNANLAYIKTVDQANPGEPAHIKYEGHGVRADIIVTGVAGTKSDPLPPSTQYGIPEVSTLMDVLVLDGNAHDCLVLSTIKAPFSAGTTQSNVITHCDDPDLARDITSFVQDQAVTGALNAAMDETIKEYEHSPFAIHLIHDHLFPMFDHAIRNGTGDEINAALATLNAPIPLKITTGNVMAPFLTFSIPTFDGPQRTVDFQFDAVGFSTTLETIINGEVTFATAMSLLAEGQGHLSKSGLNLSLQYKFNAGAGLMPMAPKYADAINGALIPKLEAYLNKLFPPNLDDILYTLGVTPGH